MSKRSLEKSGLLPGKNSKDIEGTIVACLVEKYDRNWKSKFGSTGLPLLKEFVADNLNEIDVSSTFKAPAPDSCSCQFCSVSRGRMSNQLPIIEIRTEKSLDKLVTCML